jgi:hypothetical protein
MAFAETLRGRGVEVLYLSTLLIETWPTLLRGQGPPGRRIRHPVRRHASKLSAALSC